MVRRWFSVMGLLPAVILVIFTLSTVQCTSNSSIWASKLHSTLSTEVIRDMLGYLSCNDPQNRTCQTEVREEHKGSEIWSQTTVRSRVKPHKFSSISIKLQTQPPECSAQINATNNNEDGIKTQIEGTWLAKELGPIPSVSLKIFQGKNDTDQNDFKVLLDWDENRLALRLPSVELEYITTIEMWFTDKHLNRSSVKLIFNWHFSLKANVSEGLKHSERVMHINNTFTRESKDADNSTAVFRSTLSSQSGEFQLLNFTTSSSKSGISKESVDKLSAYLPLNLIINVVFTSKERPNGDYASESVMRLTNLATNVSIELSITYTIPTENKSSTNSDDKDHFPENPENLSQVSNSSSQSSSHTVGQEAQNGRCSKEQQSRIWMQGEEGQKGSGCQAKEMNNSDDGDDNEEEEEEIFTRQNRLREFTELLTIGHYLQMQQNFTYDLTENGDKIIWIFQKLNLGICPGIGYTLQQKFNLSSDSSGWEYVVSMWEWGQMVVKANWGQSLLQNYQKTFSFSFDQDFPTPNTDVILDFKDYERYVVKITCPAMAYSVISVLNIESSRFTFEVHLVDDFLGDSGKIKLASLEGDFVGNLLNVSWSLEEERLATLARGVFEVLILTVTHPKFCGPKDKDMTLMNLLENLFHQDDGYNLRLAEVLDHHLIKHFLDVLQEIFGSAVEMFELRDLWMTSLQLYGDHVAGNSSPTIIALTRREVWWLVSKLLSGVAEETPDGKGLVFHLSKLRTWAHIAKKPWNIAESGDSKDCKIPLHWFSLLKDGWVIFNSANIVIIER